MEDGKGSQHLCPGRGTESSHLNPCSGYMRVGEPQGAGIKRYYFPLITGLYVCVHVCGGSCINAHEQMLYV